METKETQKELLTIDELAARSALFLSEVDQASGRVSGVPSRRTIRYYAQHGLLDQPVRFDGRTALYGERHVRQLVAIKKLQSRGESLTEIQGRLAGLSDQKLADLAEIEMDDEVSPRPETSRRAESFWETAPAQPLAAPETEVEAGGTIGGARLNDDVLLVLENLARKLHEDDLRAIEIAAEPLLKVLRKRHLLNPRSDDGPHNE